MMRWKRTETQLALLKIAEKCAIKATHINKEYYQKNRLTQRQEIVTVKRIASHLASDHAWMSLEVVGYFFGKHRTTAFYYVKSCQDLLDVDKTFVEIYQEAKNEFDKTLAKTLDNN